MAASFGEQLRLAREARGVSLREISEQTRISMRYLEAIESDDYKRLPGGIFNKSFIKAYAKYIGFDEGEALEAYARTSREQGGAPDEVTSTPYQPRVYTDGQSRSPLVTLLLTVLVLGILSLGVYAAVHWYQRRTAEQQQNGGAPAQPTQQNAPAQTAAAEQPAPTDKLHVQVTARGSGVWLSVSADDDRRPVFQNILAAEQSREFDPAQSLRIKYAQVNARSLEVKINGRAARVPADKSEMLITKDNYQQFIQ